MLQIISKISMQKISFHGFQLASFILFLIRQFIIHVFITFLLCQPYIPIPFEYLHICHFFQ